MTEILALTLGVALADTLAVGVEMELTVGEMDAEPLGDSVVEKDTDALTVAVVLAETEILALTLGVALADTLAVGDEMELTVGEIDAEPLGDSIVE